MDSSLSPETLQKFRSNFYADPKNILAQNVCTRIDPLDVCLSRKHLEETQHVFTHKVETEAKPITNQRNTGRCWIFATLNVIRIPFMKQYNLDEFEFSQAYLFFWDKKDGAPPQFATIILNFLITHFHSSGLEEEDLSSWYSWLSTGMARSEEPPRCLQEQTELTINFIKKL